MPIEFTRHALERIKHRRLQIGWIERVILAPGWSDADPIDPTLTRLYGQVPEMGHRILRVVASFQSPERCRVVTAFFDRDATEHIE